MGTLLLQLAHGKAVVGIEAGQLVYATAVYWLDGCDGFIKPEDAEFVRLYQEPVETPYGNTLSEVSAKVLSYDPNGTAPASGLTTVVDPLNGACSCLLTCKGVNITYVKVYNE